MKIAAIVIALVLDALLWLWAIWAIVERDYQRAAVPLLILVISSLGDIRSRLPKRSS